jgi:hypothetical protein
VLIKLPPNDTRHYWWHSGPPLDPPDCCVADPPLNKDFMTMYGFAGVLQNSENV